MRLGILDLGTPLAGLPELIADLRAQVVDVIVADERPVSDRAVWDEAKRLARADCDGVLLLTPADAPHPYLLPAQITVYLPNVPFVFAGGANKGWAATQASFWKLPGIWYNSWEVEDTLADKTSHMLFWLRTHKRRERQRGIDAAHKLYGKRFIVPNEITLAVDPYDWLRQFGILVIQGEADEEAVNVPDGNLYAALTKALLQSISGIEPSESDTSFSESTESVLTGACIMPFSPSQSSPRLIGMSTVINRADIRPVERKASISSNPLFFVPGQHTVAFRAACLTLDIHELNLHGIMEEPPT